jgi:hypothetical protein
MVVLRGERVDGRCRKHRRSNFDIVTFVEETVMEGRAMLMAVGGWCFYLLFYCSGRFE